MEDARGMESLVVNTAWTWRAPIRIDERDEPVSGRGPVDVLRDDFHPRTWRPGRSASNRVRTCAGWTLENHGDRDAQYAGTSPPAGAGTQRSVRDVDEARSTDLIGRTQRVLEWPAASFPGYRATARKASVTVATGVMVPRSSVRSGRIAMAGAAGDFDHQLRAVSTIGNL
jgi:hypothetical protein